MAGRRRQNRPAIHPATEPPAACAAIGQLALSFMPKETRIIAVAALAMGAACHDATGPKRSCSGPRLLFAQTGGSSAIQVETANGDGSGVAVLVQTTPGAGAGVWSPDGCQIAYTAELKLFVANGDGSNAKAIFTGSAPLDYPAWRPDGKQLLVTQGYGFGAHVWRVRRDGSSAAPITSDTRPTWSGTWSSDGSFIAYVRGASTTNTSPMQLVVINDNGTAPRVVSDSANQGPAWIPGTHRVTYGHYVVTNGSEVRAVNADGSDDRLLAGGLPNPLDLAWTPRADTLYFVAPGPPTPDFVQHFNIYMVKSDGSAFAQVIAGEPSALRPNAHP